MKSFLKEYWPWIVIPFALVAAGIAVLMFLLGDDGASPFVYNAL